MPERSTGERIRVLAMHARLAARAGGTDAASIGRGFRALAAELHPDAGGERADFELLIAARDMLLARVGEPKNHHQT
jgi:hypothetical protein